jgi:MFS family permease
MSLPCRPSNPPAIQEALRSPGWFNPRLHECRSEFRRPRRACLPHPPDKYSSLHMIFWPQCLPFAPLISDGIGRRKALSIGCFLIMGGVILQALAANIGQFIASRCISQSLQLDYLFILLIMLCTVGLGICLITNAGPVLTTELAYPTQRGAITALYNTIWYFGSILSAWICYATLRTLPDSIWMWRSVLYPHWSQDHALTLATGSLASFRHCQHSYLVLACCLFLKVRAG